MVLVGRYWFYLILVLCVCREVTARCERTPNGISGPKTPGDNGFKITISGNPGKYVPGETYTVQVHGMKTSVSAQKFIGFLLVVETADDQLGTSDLTKTGSFQLQGDAFTKISDECPNAVVHTGLVPKTEIQVLWTAPSGGSGCVYFRASVAETKETWYMDDGHLTKELCEEEAENIDEQPDILVDCCACDEAKYEVTFEGLWSRQTHPKDFPTNEWLTHFSDIIGASHSPDYSMWDYGGTSSEGLRQVAEWGSTRKLESELKAESDHIRTIVKARGLWYPNVNGKTFAVFRVDRRHHLMSLVSMLGPSPDWIVGVSKLELCQRDCTWVPQRTFNLYPWDAGTDSGVTYMSVNAPTSPREKIRRITSSFPNNDKAPFYDPSGAPMKPLAILTISRQRVYEKSCDDNDFETDNNPDIVEFDDRPECAVTDWGPFSPCSVTCGKGIQMRSREYLNNMKATMMNCDLQLVSKEMCQAEGNPTCSPDDDEEEPSPHGLDDRSRCSTTKWSEWSECSVTCGKGQRTRNRNYQDRMSRKVCNRQLVEKEVCMAAEECDTNEQDDPVCAVTQWSEWSPCTVTCGKGMKVRTRLYLHLHNRTHCNVELMQKVPCIADKPDCSLSFHEAKEVCMLPKEVGPCRGYFPKWYFEPSKRMCIQFIYGGCRGNRNNFDRFEDCSRMCEMMKGPASPPFRTIGNHGNSGGGGGGGERGENAVNCMATEWTEWSQCSVTCGRGRIERTRMIKVFPENGGKPCPKKLKQRKRCRTGQPCDLLSYQAERSDRRASYQGEDHATDRRRSFDESEHNALRPSRYSTGHTTTRQL